jgi:uncharacterized protein
MSDSINEKQTRKSVMQTVIKMAPAILTALVATGLGFLALYTSPVPMIQDFGKMLTIGMIVSFIIGLFLTVPILYVRDRFFLKEKKEGVKASNKTTSFEVLLNKFARKVISIKWIIILLALTTAGFGIWADLRVGVETDIENFMPQNVQELKDIHKLRDVLGTTDQISILYNGENVLSEKSLTWIDNITEALGKEFPQVVVETKSLTSVMRQINENKAPTASEVKEFIKDMPESQLKLLLNKERSKGVITVGIKHLEAQELKSFIENLNDYISNNSSQELEVTVTGKSVLDVEMMSALTTGRYKMTLLGMVAVFLGLLFIYRHPVKAFIPLLPIILIVGWSGGVMYLFDIKYTPLTATLGALIIGIGTEFTILIMERFFEENEKADSSIDAISVSVGKIGIAIFASAITTIGGFSALLISDFKILSNFGMMTLINIFLALLSTIAVMPPILIILSRFVQTREKAKEIQQLETD